MYSIKSQDKPREPPVMSEHALHMRPDSVWRHTQQTLDKHVGDTFMRNFMDQIVLYTDVHSQKTIDECISALGVSATLKDVLMAAYLVNGGVLLKHCENGGEEEATEVNISLDKLHEELMREIDGIDVPGKVSKTAILGDSCASASTPGCSITGGCDRTCTMETVAVPADTQAPEVTPADTQAAEVTPVDTQASEVTPAVTEVPIPSEPIVPEATPAALTADGADNSGVPTAPEEVKPSADITVTSDPLTDKTESK